MEWGLYEQPNQMTMFFLNKGMWKCVKPCGSECWLNILRPLNMFSPYKLNEVNPMLRRAISTSCLEDLGRLISLTHSRLWHQRDWKKQNNKKKNRKRVFKTVWFRVRARPSLKEAETTCTQWHQQNQHKQHDIKGHVHCKTSYVWLQKNRTHWHTRLSD